MFDFKYSRALKNVLYTRIVYSYRDMKQVNRDVCSRWQETAFRTIFFNPESSLRDYSFNRQNVRVKVVFPFMSIIA